MGWSAIKGEYQSAFNQAKAANEARYAETLAGYAQQIRDYDVNANQIGQGYRDLLARQERIGDSQRLDLQDQYARNLAQAQQSLIGRGLGSSTVLDAANRGAGNDFARSKIDLSDSLARQYAAVMGQKLGFQGEYARTKAGLQGGRLGMMERRTDAYPELRDYLAMAQMDGAAFGGFPMAGGGASGGGWGGSPRAASAGGGGYGYPSVIRGNGDGTYTSVGRGGTQTLNFNPYAGGGYNNPFTGNPIGEPTNPFSGQSGSYGGYGQGGGDWGEDYGYDGGGGGYEW